MGNFSSARRRPLPPPPDHEGSEMRAEPGPQTTLPGKNRPRVIAVSELDALHRFHTLTGGPSWRLDWAGLRKAAKAKGGLAASKTDFHPETVCSGVTVASMISERAGTPLPTATAAPMGAERALALAISQPVTIPAKLYGAESTVVSIELDNVRCGGQVWWARACVWVLGAGGGGMGGGEGGQKTHPLNVES